MRITAGACKGMEISTPSGRTTRPTGAKLRQALMNRLATDIEGQIVVDAYAGSGAIGLEALSRGARKCVFVESDRHAA